MKRKYRIIRDGLIINREAAAFWLGITRASLLTKLSNYGRAHPNTDEIALEELMQDRRIISNRILVDATNRRVRIAALAREFGVSPAYVGRLIAQNLPRGRITDAMVRAMWQQHNKEITPRPRARRHYQDVGPGMRRVIIEHNRERLVDIWNELYGDLEPKEKE